MSKEKILENIWDALNNQDLQLAFIESTEERSVVVKGSFWQPSLK